MINLKKSLVVYTIVIGLLFTNLGTHAFASTEVQLDNELQKRVVAYFPEWGVYWGHGNYMPADMPWDKLTHVNYAFTRIKDGKIALFDEYAATELIMDGEAWDSNDNGTLGQFRKLKSAHPNTKMLVSVGGWTLSGQFHFAAETAASRKVFADSVVDFIREWGFDGVDIDWEYVGVKREPDTIDNINDEGTPYADDAETQNFTYLMRDLRSALDKAGKEDGNDYLLTAAVPGGIDKIEKLEPGKFEQYLDFMNVMTYDLHGAWENVTGHHTQLYANPAQPYTDETKYYYTDYALETYKKLGVPANKLVVGSPLYSRGWKGVENNGPIKELPGLFATATGGANGIWDGGRSAGNNPYYYMIEELENDPAFKKYRDPYSKAPYLYSESKKEFYTYEDKISLTEKINYVNESNYGGIVVWELTGDLNPKTGKAHGGGEMIELLFQGLNGGVLPEVPEQDLPVIDEPNHGNNDSQPIDNPEVPVDLPIEESTAKGIPGEPSVSHNNWWPADGDYTITMNMWWGINGTTARLYENNILIEEKTLKTNGNNAQRIDFNIQGRPNGTYTYILELSNDIGSNLSNPLVMNITQSTYKPVDIPDSSDKPELPNDTETQNKSVVYQAENAKLKNALVKSDHLGYLGTGFADYKNRKNAYIEWTIDAEEACLYKLEFRYAVKGNRPLRLSVNGKTVEETLQFPNLNNWDKWDHVFVETELKAGKNTIRLTTIKKSGPNIDCLTVSKKTSNVTPSEPEKPAVQVDDNKGLIFDIETYSDTNTSFTTSITLKNSNTTYKWDAAEHTIWGFSFNTTSKVKKVSGAESYKQNGDTVTILMNSWETTLLMGDERNVVIEFEKDNNVIYPENFKVQFMRDEDIYPDRPELPESFSKNKSNLEEADLIVDKSSYYNKTINPIEDGLILYNSPSDTQINIGLASDVYTNLTSGIKMWVPSKYLAMGLGYVQEIYGINPNYMAALGTKENFSFAVYPTREGALSHPVEIDGQTWYWGMTSGSIDGPFQQETPNFNEVKDFFPDSFPENAKHNDYTFVSESIDDSKFIKAAISSAASLTMTREYMYAGPAFEFKDFVNNAKDKAAEDVLLTYIYNRGLYSVDNSVFAADREENMKSDNLVETLGYNGFADHVPQVLGILKKMNAETDDIYDVRLTKNDINVFIDELRIFYPHGVPTNKEWENMKIDVGNAFDTLEKYWGDNTISYRYDFLTLVRVMKEHLPSEIPPSAKGMNYAYQLMNRN